MQWFRNFRVGLKLGLGFGLLAVLAVALGVQGITGLKKMNDDVVSMGDNSEGLRAIMEANLQVLRLSRAVRNAILDDDRASVEGRIASMKTYDQALAKALQDWKSKIVLQETHQKTAVLEQFITTRLRPEQDRVVALALEQRDREAAQQLSAIRQLADSTDAMIEELQTAKIEVMHQREAQAAATFASLRRFAIGELVVAVVLAFLVAGFVTRLITGTLQGVSQTMGHAAQGDLTARAEVSSKDELGQTAGTLNNFLDTLHDSMSQVAQASAQLSSAAQELSSGATDISSGAQEQASSLEETAASLEEMTSTIRQNADNAQQANQLAAGARSVAEQGGAVVAEAVQAMKEINDSSKRIADIITTIDEIAFQTNLLALNAAVEAARAGEQGRGFAVVAGEVRNLAQRSATAAKEIKGLIQDSVQKVENGSDLVNQSGQTLTEIVTSVKRVTDIVAEIAAASREQAAGVEQVNKAVTQMDQVTQRNAAQTEELTATAEALASQGEQLQALVGKFKLSATATVAAPVAHVARPVAKKPVKTAARKPEHKAPPREPALARKEAVAAPAHDDAGFEEF